MSKRSNYSTYIPPPPATGSISLSSGMDQKGFVANTESAADRAERWHYKPLERMEHPDDGFVLLTTLMPLYEKYLRYVYNMGEDADFSNNCPAIQEIMRTFGVQLNDAHRLWEGVRHGLLHRAAMKKNTKYGLFQAILERQREQPSIRLENGVFIMRPWALRAQLLVVFRQNPKMWKSDDYPMLVEYVPTKG